MLEDNLKNENQSPRKRLKPGRKALDSSSNTVVLGVKVSQDLKDEFETIANSMGLDLSALTRLVMKSFIAEYKKK